MDQLSEENILRRQGGLRARLDQAMPPRGSAPPGSSPHDRPAVSGDQLREAFRIRVELAELDLQRVDIRRSAGDTVPAGLVKSARYVLWLAAEKAYQDYREKALTNQVWWCPTSDHHGPPRIPETLTSDALDRLQELWADVQSARRALQQAPEV
jgi:hypothetical protein